MINIPQEKLADRFMRYVQVDTQSDPNSEQYPTTEKQKDLSQILLRELTALGLSAETDEYGYVYAELPANSNKPGIPSICFCSHVDTAPDCSGTGVKPILHRHYQGQDIVLPDDATQVLRKADSPYLGQCMGHDIITASGNALLGADDKSGVAVIMQAVEYLIQHPEIKHGPVKIVSRPMKKWARVRPGSTFKDWSRLRLYARRWRSRGVLKMKLSAPTGQYCGAWRDRSPGLCKRQTEERH